MSKFSKLTVALIALLPLSAMAQGTHPSPVFNHPTFDDPVTTRTNLGLAYGTTPGTVADGGLLQSTINSLSALQITVTSFGQIANAAIPGSARGATNGVAELGSNGLVPTNELPSGSGGSGNSFSLGTPNGAAQLDGNGYLLTAELPPIVVTDNGLAVTALQPAAIGTTIAPLVSGKVPSSYLPTNGSVTGLTNILLQFADQTPKVRLLFTNSDPAGTAMDSSGNGNNLVYSGLATPPVHNADGSVSFNGADTAAPLPSAVSGIAMYDVCIAQAIELPQSLGLLPNPSTNTIIGAASGNGLMLQLTQSYGGSSTGQGYALDNMKLNQYGGGGTMLLGGAGLDNGIHCYHVDGAPGTTAVDVWEDGVLLPLDKSIVAFNSIASAWVPALGGNPQATTPSTVAGTATYEYFSASATVYPSAQRQALVQQDYRAEMALMTYKGIVSNPGYGPTDVNNIAYTFAESTGSAYQLGNPPTNNYFGTENFTYLAMGILNNAYGSATETIGSNSYPANDNWQNITNGNNDATGYTMMQPCATQLNAVGQNASGYREALFWSHGNSLGPADGTYASGTSYWPAPNNDISAASQTFGDLNGFNECMAKTNHRWVGIVGTIIGGPSGVTFANHQAIANPMIRQYGSTLGFEVFDPANDGRFGYLINTSATGGSGYQGALCTLPGGSAVTTYGSDHNHPSLCGQTILANMFAAVTADVKQKYYPRIATVSATYSMGLPDIDGFLAVPGGGTLTLMPCGGLYNARMLTLTNNGSTAEIVQAGTEYDGGIVDTIYSDTGASGNTYQLQPGQTKTFKVQFPTGSDGTANGICRLQIAA